jgi:valyl-tRNA synthetase
VIFLPLEGVVDAASERKRLEDEMMKVTAEIDKAARKLASESFVRNAPAEVVEDHRRRETTWKVRLEALRAARDALGT